MDEEEDCPVCTYPLEPGDLNFKPCPCGFQICGFCYHEIAASVNPSCPSCRAKYKTKNIEFTAPSDAEVAKRIESKRKNLKKSKKKTDRERLSKMRIMQRNLVYVTNLPVEFGTEEILSKPEFFGQYGKIKKIAINRALLNSSLSNSQDGNNSNGHKSNKSASVSAYNGGPDFQPVLPPAGNNTRKLLEQHHQMQQQRMASQAAYRQNHGHNNNSSGGGNSNNGYSNRNYSSSNGNVTINNAGNIVSGSGGGAGGSGNGPNGGGSRHQHHHNNNGGGNHYNQHHRQNNNNNHNAKERGPRKGRDGQVDVREFSWSYRDARKDDRVIENVWQMSDETVEEQPFEKSGVVNVDTDLFVQQSSVLRRAYPTKNFMFFASREDGPPVPVLNQSK